MTDRQAARLIALLREAAAALAVSDRTLAARLDATADHVVRGVYDLPARDDRRDHDRFPALSL